MTTNQILTSPIRNKTIVMPFKWISLECFMAPTPLILRQILEVVLSLDPSYLVNFDENDDVPSKFFRLWLQSVICLILLERKRVACDDNLELNLQWVIFTTKDVWLFSGSWLILIRFDKIEILGSSILYAKFARRSF